MGFAPFELFYGRPVCGPLDLVQETWEAEVRSVESVVSSMPEKLVKMTELVKKKFAQVTCKSDQKRWYDRN